MAIGRHPSSPRPPKIWKHIAQMSENLIHQRLGKNNSGYTSQLSGQKTGKLKKTSVLREIWESFITNNYVNAPLFQSLLPGSPEEHQLGSKKAMDIQHPDKGSFPTDR